MSTLPVDSQLNDKTKDLRYLLSLANAEVRDSVVLPERPASYSPIPKGLTEPLRNHLSVLYPKGLYSHQAYAVNKGLKGIDLCLSTPTASGKSCVFMALAAQLVLERPPARVMALYPTRALVQDQMNKWKEFLSPFGLEPGLIDGSIPVKERLGILKRKAVLLLTPDVVHAWLMSNCQADEVSELFGNLKLLILDEAHCYDGVFGTNTAYLMRRLAVLTSSFQLVCSTATIGEPKAFIRKLTGREVDVIQEPNNGSLTPSKMVLLAEPTGCSAFDSTVTLIQGLAGALLYRFLSFADSRKAVEQLVAAAKHNDLPVDHPLSVLVRKSRSRNTEQSESILPYRSGYESHDRIEIQKALTAGQLMGVVSTSAMELGIDIGEIDVVVMTGVPRMAKSFWQRMGRAGRKTAGFCILIDGGGALIKQFGSLEKYLKREVEPNWLYLDNRYIQYTHALCAALECEGKRQDSEFWAGLSTLPGTFVEMLENELQPTTIPPDLYPLKQRAITGPHYEFPLRTAGEKEFQIIGPGGSRLGTVTHSQLLREAYPGGIYYYMSKPYRVKDVNFYAGEISVRPERHWTTRPIINTKVFPRFDGSLHQLHISEKGFLAEAKVQVSQRLRGFTEKRGPNSETYMYEPGSPHSQRPLDRFFETTAVCWFFPDQRTVATDIAESILEIFCLEYGIYGGDVGCAQFFSKTSPLENQKNEGVCVFDSTSGSLRLTQRLCENFCAVVERTVEAAVLNGDRALEETARILLLEAQELHTTWEFQGMVRDDGVFDPETVEVIAPGESAMLIKNVSTFEVKVLNWRYTPKGIIYDLEHSDSKVRWQAEASALRPINGVTSLIHVNLMTGEVIGSPHDSTEQ